MGESKLLPIEKDVMIDFDRIDREQHGRLTEVKKITVRRLHTRYGVSVAEIAARLHVGEAEVEEALQETYSSSFTLR